MGPRQELQVVEHEEQPAGDFNSCSCADRGFNLVENHKATRLPRASSGKRGQVDFIVNPRTSLGARSLSLSSYIPASFSSSASVSFAGAVGYPLWISDFYTYTSNSNGFGQGTALEDIRVPLATFTFAPTDVSMNVFFFCKISATFRVNRMGHLW